MEVKDFEDRCEVQCIHEDKVREVKAKMIDADTVGNLADIFKALGDPTRIKILYALLQKELCVCDIAAVTGNSDSAVSHQLRILRGQKLVRFRRDGKVLYYSLADDHVAALFAQGLEHVSE